LKQFLRASLLISTCLVSGLLISPSASGSGGAPSDPFAIQSTPKGGSTTAATSAAHGAASASSRGAQLFQRDCAHCHGKAGDGNSPVRATLHPQPLDLTNFHVSDAYVLQVLHNGIPGSDMPAWHVSPEKDLRQEAAYAASLAHPDALSEQDQYAPPEALSEAGKRVYDAHCARCHGTSGNGDGPDARKYRPRPPSFAGVRPSFAGARHVIENGVAGTAMSSWPLLTPPEIQAVTFYIRSFYNDGTEKRSSNAAATGVQP
jgi:mono/diheme cytochrome c family protein